MKMASAVLILFSVSFLCGFSAGYAADELVLSSTAHSGNKSSADFSKLSYHNRGSTWQPTEIANEQAQIKKIQLRLTVLGYPCGEVDGIFGPNTELAVKIFQKENQLIVDGLVGPATKKALKINN